jgi:hypothetical protein
MKIKAAQLDLARQKETVDYVLGFADTVRNACPPRARS